jgi:hypothetical protein
MMKEGNGTAMERRGFFGAICAAFGLGAAAKAAPVVPWTPNGLKDVTKRDGRWVYKTLEVTEWYWDEIKEQWDVIRDPNMIPRTKENQRLGLIE